MILGSLCGYQSSSFFAVVNKETSDAIDDLKLNTILVNLSNDENTCFHCVQSHIGFYHLRKLIEQQQIRRERNEAFKGIRMLLNILSITNTIVTLLVYGGPKLIFLVTLFSSIGIFGSIYVEKVSHAVLFESAVVLVSAITLLKSLYVLMVQAMVLEKRKNS